MGAGLTITRVLTIFLLFYILFGFLTIFLFIDHPVFEEVVSKSNVLIIALSWPFFIYSIVKDQGQIVSLIASVIILSVGAILMWLAYVVENILVKKDHKETEEKRYENLAEAHESYLKKKNNSNKLKQKSGEMNFKPNLQKVIFSLVISFFMTLITAVVTLLPPITERLEQTGGILRTAMIRLPKPIMLLYLLILLVLYYIAVYIIWSFIEKSKIKSKKRSVEIIKRKK